ncbi:unnamed protein product [Orchesella dallaii]|uniref:phenylalanine--tRNA ligase n=1 Tax=Orchesella dallaii TaxID=48710 RepID=A0ABP1Q5T9_9HEXA
MKMASCACAPLSVTGMIQRSFKISKFLLPQSTCSSGYLRLSHSRNYSQSVVNPVENGNGDVNFAVTPTATILNGKTYPVDEYTNVNPKILSYTCRKLHLQKYNPLCHVKRRIIDFIYKEFPSRTRSPLFSVFDDLDPAVSVEQNFDSILIPKDHPSRKKSDNYYLNNNHLLRAHTSSHQAELIRSGLNNFLVVGDVYRRDEIDKTHFPAFHQVEAVRLCGLHDVFRDENIARELKLFETGKCVRTPEKQETHTVDAVMMMTSALKTTLIKLVQHLFGKDVETRWVETFFPFTHPSWELEVNYNGEWLEVLGCGIMEQSILQNAGAGDKIGWAFGLGLERLAMKLYQIPDIRLFWSVDSGVVHQFKVDDPYAPIIYKPVSQYPPCKNDISFWLPENSTFSSADFYDLVRSIGGELVEQVSLVDEFYHKKKQRWSHCYRIIYRDMSKTLTQEEANVIHAAVEQAAAKNLRVDIR